MNNIFEDLNLIYTLLSAILFFIICLIYYNEFK
jgi:hypothetical protein